MFKTIVIGLIFFSFGLPAFAQVATTTEATSTPMVGGHRHTYLAGSEDSRNSKGAWLLSNYPVSGQLVYVAENPSIAEQWKAVMFALYHMEIK